MLYMGLLTCLTVSCVCGLKFYVFDFIKLSTIIIVLGHPLCVSLIQIVHPYIFGLPNDHRQNPHTQKTLAMMSSKILLVPFQFLNNLCHISV